MQTPTDHGVLCSCPCDKYSYTGLHDKLRTELYLYDIYLLCQHHSLFDLLEQGASELVSVFQNTFIIVAHRI